MLITYICELCNKSITKQKNLKYKARFCSARCRNVFAGGRKKSPRTKEHTENQRKTLLGKKLWGGKRDNMDWITGENSQAWKGDKVGYRALHSWVQREKGKAMTCEICNSFGGEHGCHWANISGEYIRDKKDFVSLCPKCHKMFDRIERRVSPLVS